MTKRFLSLILALIFLLSACGGKTSRPDAPDASPGTPSGKAENDVLTRGQWIQRLTDTMGYAEEFDGSEGETAPYFTDVQAGNAAYASVQTAAAYSILDLDTDRFNPDGAATREFTAVTAAKAVGLCGEPAAELQDIAGLPDADNIRLAVDGGLFSCPDGNFNPRGSVTAAEAGAVLQRVREFTTITIDPNHVDTLTINEGVIDLSKSSAVTFNDPDAMSVRMSGHDAAALEAGAVYLLPPTAEYPYGVARKVKSITQSGADYIIENEEPSIEEVIEDIDIQGVYTPDYSKIIWEEGVHGEVITGVSSASEGYTVRNLGAQAQPLVDIDDFTFGFNLKLNENLEVSGSLVFHEFEVTTHISKYGELSFAIRESHTLTLSATIKVELKKEWEWPLCTIPIPAGATGAVLMAKVSLTMSGEVSFSMTLDKTTETIVRATWPYAANSRVLDSSSGFEIAGTWKAGLTPAISLDIWGLSFLEVSLFIGVAVDAVLTSAFCADYTIWLPLHIRLSLFKFSFDTWMGRAEFEFFVQFDIWKKSNSPFLLHWHHENGIFVDECTRTREIVGAELLADLWALLDKDRFWLTRDNVYYSFFTHEQGAGRGTGISIFSPAWFGDYEIFFAEDAVHLGGFRYRLDGYTLIPWNDDLTEGEIYEDISMEVNLGHLHAGELTITLNGRNISFQSVDEVYDPY